MSEITWHEAKKPLRELRDYQYNPRQIDDAAFKRLVDSLKQDGYHTRIKVNLDGVIIGGHARKRALLAAGFKEDDLIEVLLPDHMLTAEEFDRINIRDNLNYGVFDQDLLAQHFDVDKLRAWGMAENLLSKAVNPLDEMPVLDTGDKPVFQQKTFTLHDEQAGLVDIAIRLAKSNPLIDTGLNENSNGNALAYICEQWLANVQS